MSAQCTICQKEKRPDELISWENVDTGEKHRLCKDCNGEWEIQLEEYEHTDWMRTNIRNR